LSLYVCMSKEAENYDLFYFAVIKVVRSNKTLKTLCLC
jgi:hypothetical protein